VLLAGIALLLTLVIPGLRDAWRSTPQPLAGETPAATGSLIVTVSCTGACERWAETDVLVLDRWNLTALRTLTADGWTVTAPTGVRRTLQRSAARLHVRPMREHRRLRLDAVLQPLCAQQDLAFVSLTGGSALRIVYPHGAVAATTPTTTPQRAAAGTEWRVLPLADLTAAAACGVAATILPPAARDVPGAFTAVAFLEDGLRALLIAGAVVACWRLRRFAAAAVARRVRASRWAVRQRARRDAERTARLRDLYGPPSGAT
jgi:hypothetical protein